MSSTAMLSATAAESLDLATGAPAIGHGIVSRTLLGTPELRAVLFNFSAGQSLTEHSSASRVLIQVLSGAGEFTVAGATRVLRAGGLLHLPPGAPHTVNATEPMTMLLILAPQREKPSGA